MTAYLKDPDAVLDYAWDWTAWLAEGETISAATVTATGVTVDSSSEDGGVVTAWISGGTAGVGATATCRVVTSQGRTDDRSLSLTIAQR